MGINHQFSSDLRSGEPVVGTWINIGHPTVAEISAKLGFDFVFVEMEHSPNSLQMVENVIRATECGESPAAIVRVPENDPVKIKQVLDTGADGIIVPMVETAEEATLAVEATQYPPDGIRGIAPSRAASYGIEFDEYMGSINDAVVTIVQIETKKGLANAAEIAAVDGIDATFVGPGDLSGSLGVLGDWDNQEMIDAVNDIIAKSNEEDVPVGTVADEEEDISRWINHGFDFLVAGVDTGYLMSGGSSAKEAFNSAIEDENTED